LDGEHVRVADEARSERRRGRAIDLRRRPDLLDPPLVEHGDAIRQRERLPLIVGHVDERGARLAVHAPQLRLHVQADLQVERRERLVEEQHPRTVDERTRERDALELPARELVSAPRPVALEANEREHLVDAPAHLVGRRPRDPEPEGDVLEDVEVGEERRALEDHVHRPSVGRQAGHVPPLEEDSPVARSDEAGDDPQERGLSAAGRAEERDELSVLEREGDVVEGGDGSILVRDPFEDERARARWRAPQRQTSAVGASGRGATSRVRRRSLRSVRRNAITQSASEIASRSVEIVAIDGSIVRRSRDQMRSGSVEFDPMTKNVITNSSKESANARQLAPRRIGQIWGSVTFRKTRSGLAPRSAAASSRAGSSRSSAAPAIRRKYGNT
jgi:hypothetical protein